MPEAAHTVNMVLAHRVQARGERCVVVPAHVSHESATVKLGYGGVREEDVVRHSSIRARARRSIGDSWLASDSAVAHTAARATNSVCECEAHCSQESVLS